MIYDRQWFLDVRAKLDQANGLKDTPPQNNHAAPVFSADEPEWHVYWPAASTHEVVVGCDDIGDILAAAFDVDAGC